jgi:hypothetical protein
VVGQDFYLRAFWYLSSCRQLGQSIGPIPSDKSEWYAVCKAGLDPAMAEAFMYVMVQMDAAYLEWIEEENEKRRKYGGKRGKPGAK